MWRTYLGETLYLDFLKDIRSPEDEKPTGVSKLELPTIRRFT